MNRSLVVPADFLGMHFHRWPQGRPDPSPAPQYSYGTVRSHDYGISWYDIHVAPGRYSWDRMDTWVHTHALAGKTLIYTLYGTPEWASSNPEHADAYGRRGGAAPPKHPAILAEFISPLDRRYNTPSVQRIRFLELWNEPHFLRNGRGFWWGTADELAELCRVICTQARSADPRIKILSPGFDGLQPGHYSPNISGTAASLRDFLLAQDGTGASPGHLLDGISIHAYNMHVENYESGIEGLLLQARETLAASHLRLPLYVTECGYAGDQRFAALTLDDKALLLKRQAAVQAALGVQYICFYAHDDDYCGNPSIYPPISAALNEINGALAGAKLHQVMVGQSGQLGITTSSRHIIY